MLSLLRGLVVLWTLAATPGGANGDRVLKPTLTWTEGLATPESVLHDARADLYYVSSVQGPSGEADNNGFISRLSPDGRVLDARWIAGGSRGVTLHAPKGMALVGDTLYVADLDTIRLFDRTRGTPLGEVRVEGATFLNDVAAGEGGEVFVSDSGSRMGASGMEPTGTDAIYRLDPTGRLSTLAKSPGLGRPNGLLYAWGKLWVVNAGGELYWIDGSGRRRDIVRLPGGRLDGVIQVDDELIVSSWEAQALFRGPPGGPFREVAGGLRAPADIGHDAGRGRVLVPRFQEHRLEAYELP